MESVGLHGPSFAVGAVVVDRSGIELDSFYASYAVNVQHTLDEDGEWVKANVMPVLYGITHGDCVTMMESFWAKWLVWREQDAVMAADCAWPVETNFLSNCVSLSREERKMQGPYPLLDISSVLFAAGIDPTPTFNRQRGELPIHNPLCDARQSARILIETLDKLEHK